MKFYKDKDGRLFAFEDDGSQDDVIPEKLKKLSEKEVTDLKALSDEQKALKYRQIVNDFIDAKAQELGFESALTAVTYADEPEDPINQKYGTAVRKWRSACWKVFREKIATWQVDGGGLTNEKLIANLPPFVTPE